MNRKAMVVYSALVTLGCANLAYVESANATNVMNMFNPSKWFNSNSDRRYRDDYYYDRPYGYRGYGPGWGGYGPGWGGYGPGWGGYGPGWGGYNPYGYGAPGHSAPQTQPAPERIPQ